MSAEHGDPLHEALQQGQPFSSLQEESYLALLRTADLLLLAHQRLFREHGLSSSLYNALRIIVGAGEQGIPVRSIGGRMVVREPDASRLVDRLERMKVVQRTRCREDRRRVLVRALPRGIALADELREPLRALQDRLFGAFSAEELRGLNDLLERARAAARQQTES